MKRALKSVGFVPCFAAATMAYIEECYGDRVLLQSLCDYYTLQTSKWLEDQKQRAVM